MITWYNAQKRRPRKDSSILVFDDSGNIHRCIYDHNGNTIGSSVIETENGYKAVLNRYEWSQVLFWIYANDLENEYKGE